MSGNLTNLADTLSNMEKSSSTNPASNDILISSSKESIRVTRSDPVTSASQLRGQSLLRNRPSQQQQQSRSKERRARWIRDKKLVHPPHYHPQDYFDDHSSSPSRFSQQYSTRSGSEFTDSGYQDRSSSAASAPMRPRLKLSRSGDGGTVSHDWFMSENESKGSKYHVGFDPRHLNQQRRPFSFREQLVQTKDSDRNRQRLRAGLSLPVQNSFAIGPSTAEEYLDGRTFIHSGGDHFDDEEDPEEEEDREEKQSSSLYLSRQTRLPYPYCNLRNHNNLITTRSRSPSPCSISSESAESQTEKALDPPRLSIRSVGGIAANGLVPGGDSSGLTLGVGGGVIGGGYGNHGRKLSVLFSSYDAWNEEHIVQSFKELSPTATSIFEACWSGNTEALGAILEDPENQKTLAEDAFRDNEGRTPLHLASACGHVPCVQLLISKGADVNSCDSNEKATPLACAASCGSVTVVGVLLEHGANVNAGYEHGKTALHWAIQAGSVDCAKKLLDAGAKQNPPQVYSETPLHVAAALGDSACLQLLLDYRADLHLCKGSNRSTALHLSAEEGSVACVKLLLSAGASHKAKDVRGHTPLHVAATCDADCVMALLKAGADCNAVDANGRTPLHCAVARGSRAAECVRLLVESGADIDAQDNYGYTPLHLSAVNESSQCASILLHKGSDVTLKTNSGTTALSLLVRRIPDVMRYLVERLDSAVTIHDHDPADPDCEIRLDFRAIVPNCEKRGNNGKGHANKSAGDYRGGGRGKRDSLFHRPRRETEFLTCLVGAGNKKILAHPLSEAFLTLKWRRVRKFFWASLLFQIALVALFTIYVIEVYLIQCQFRREAYNQPTPSPYSAYPDNMDAMHPPPISSLLFITNNDNATAPSPPPPPNISRSRHNVSKRSADPCKGSSFQWFSFKKRVPCKKAERTESPVIRTITPGKPSSSQGPRPRHTNLPVPTLDPPPVIVEDRHGFHKPPSSATAEEVPKDASGEANLQEDLPKWEAVHCELDTTLQVIWFMLVAFTSLMAIKEIFQLVQSPFAYVVSSENWGQWLLIASVTITAWSTPDGVYLTYWQYPAAACGIFLAWGLMLLQVGRFPALGLYVQMLGKVAANFGLFILAYACLLIAFALAFCVLFPEYPPYSSVALSILKVFTMMVGEVDYEDLFYSDDRNDDPLIIPLTAHLLYGAFVVFVTIVLMNLLVGLAVHDIQGLQKGAKLNRLSRQTALISRLESFIFSKRLQALLPRSLGSLLQKSALLVPSSYNWSYYFRPNDPRDRRLPKEIKAASLRLAASRHSSGKSKSHAYHQIIVGDNLVRNRPISRVSHTNSAMYHPEVAARRLEHRLDHLEEHMEKVFANMNGRMDAILGLLLDGKIQGVGDVRGESSDIVPEEQNSRTRESTKTSSASPSPSTAVQTPTFPSSPYILKDCSCEKG